MEQGTGSIHIKKYEGKEYFAVPVGELRKIAGSDLKRPAPIFNEFGLSRILWQDGSESKIEYENGRIAHLPVKRAVPSPSVWVNRCIQLGEETESTRVSKLLANTAIAAFLATLDSCLINGG